MFSLTLNLNFQSYNTSIILTIKFVYVLFSNVVLIATAIIILKIIEIVNIVKINVF